MPLIDTLFNSVFIVMRKIRASDAQGGWSESMTTVGTILGRMCPGSASERDVGDQRQSQISHVLYCPATIDIHRGDTVTGESRTYKVVAVREPSHAGHHLEIDCQETQQEGEP